MTKLARNQRDGQRRLGRRTIRHVECDQSPFLSRGTTDLAGAVRQQDRMTSDLTAIRYYGIINVPLQFLAECSVLTWHQVIFDLNRSYQQWHESGEGRGPELD